MLNQVEMQQNTDQNTGPTKKRIGRARFLLELIIAGALLKVGSEVVAHAKTTVGLVVFPLLFVGIGLFIAVWAGIRRLRDIKRSEWWATVLVLWFALGFAAGFSGTDVTANTFVNIAYMVILLFLGVLLFWPSAYRSSITIPAMLSRLNGWQRIGLALTVLWFAFIFGLALTGIDPFVETIKGKPSHCTALAPKLKLGQKMTSDEFDVYPCAVGAYVEGTPDQKRIMWDLVATVAFGVAVVAWVLVYLTIIVIRWIAKGFNRNAA